MHFLSKDLKIRKIVGEWIVSGTVGRKHNTTNLQIIQI